MFADYECGACGHRVIDVGDEEAMWGIPPCPMCKADDWRKATSSVAAKYITAECVPIDGSNFDKDTYRGECMHEECGGVVLVPRNPVSFDIELDKAYCCLCGQKYEVTDPPSWWS